MTTENSQNNVTAVTQERARAIMGTNFLGIEDVIKHFSVSFTDDEMAALRDIPFTEAELLECKDTHVLFPGYPLSILEIQYRVPSNRLRIPYHIPLEDKDFSKMEKVGLRWYLIRNCSEGRAMAENYWDQIALLDKTEEVPRACEMIYMIMLYFMVYQKCLFDNYFVRCKDNSSKGYCVSIGNFHVYLNVCCWDFYVKDGHIGLATSRKPSLEY
jgi:hypothetical protein